MTKDEISRERRDCTLPNLLYVHVTCKPTFSKLLLLLFTTTPTTTTYYYYYYYNHFMALWILSGTTWVSWYQKGKISLDLLEQEIVSENGTG